MIAVGRIIVGRQHRREEPAGAVADLVQEGGLFALAAPAAEHADPPPAGEGEAGNVDRIGMGMLAPRPAGAAVEAAARIASEMFDGDHVAAEMAPRRGLDDMPLPK